MCTLLAAQCLLYRTFWHQGVNCHDGHHTCVLHSIWGQVIHARMIYLVLNLVTGCVSPQYHCCFNDFFKTMHHGAPDVSGTICWQQLAHLDHAKTVLSEVSMPNQHSIISLETSSDEEPHTMSNTVFKPNTFDTTSDDYSISEASQVSETVTLLGKIGLLTLLMR